eukprot:scpid30896/ scgid14880/ 
MPYNPMTGAHPEWTAFVEEMSKVLDETLGDRPRRGSEWTAHCREEFPRSARVKSLLDDTKEPCKRHKPLDLDDLPFEKYMPGPEQPMRHRLHWVTGTGFFRGQQPEPYSNLKTCFSYPAPGTVLTEVDARIGSFPLNYKRRACVWARGKDSQEVQEIERRIHTHPTAIPYRAECDKELDILADPPRGVQKSLKREKLFWEVTLLHYINILGELIYFVDFYWRIKYPSNRLDRERIVLHLFYQVFNEKVVQILRDVSREFTLADLYVLVGKMVTHSFVMYHPKDHLDSVTQLPKLIIMICAWQMRLCRPSYYLLLMTWNHVDGIRNIVKPYADHAVYPASTHGTQSLELLETLFRRTFWLFEIGEWDLLRDFMIRPGRTAIPNIEAKRLQPLLECGLCHHRLKYFFTLNHHVIQNEPRRYFISLKEYSKTNPVGRRKILLGRSVYEYCTKYREDGTVDFFPPIPREEPLSLQFSEIFPGPQKAKQRPAGAYVKAEFEKTIGPLQTEVIRAPKPRACFSPPLQDMKWPSSKRYAENQLIVETRSIMNKEKRMSFFFARGSEKQPIMLERIRLISREHAEKFVDKKVWNHSMNTEARCAFALGLKNLLSPEKMLVAGYLKALKALAKESHIDIATSEKVATDSLRKYLNWSAPSPVPDETRRPTYRYCPTTDRFLMMCGVLRPIKAPAAAPPAEPPQVLDPYYTLLKASGQEQGAALLLSIQPEKESERRSPEAVARILQKAGHEEAARIIIDWMSSWETREVFKRRLERSDALKRGYMHIEKAAESDFLEKLLDDAYW